MVVIVLYERHILGLKEAYELSLALRVFLLWENIGIGKKNRGVRAVLQHTLHDSSRARGATAVQQDLMSPGGSAVGQLELYQNQK